MTASQSVIPDRSTRYLHEAVVYRDARQYVDLNAPFLAAGVAAGEPVVAVVSPPNIALLTAALGAAAESVRFVDMTDVGRNPARLIPLWRQVVDDAGGRPVRGIGEPVWAGRRPAELAEALLHEGLLDLAFADGPPLLLRCPYDAATLDPAVLDAGCARHPTAGMSPSEWAAAEFAGPLSPADPAAETVVFTRPSAIRGLRALITERVAAFGVRGDRAADLVLAAHEVAVNSLRHGGGRGTLRIWTDGPSLVCEIADDGHIAQPLVGRVRPLPSQLSGRGVWLANQLCDLVQIRSSAAGTVVRLHLDGQPDPV